MAHVRPPIDPVMFSLGPWEVRWYGFCFVLGLAAVWILMRRAAKSRGDLEVSHVDRAMLWISVGAVIGGRVGDILLFNPWMLWSNPRETIVISAGGMSFHGGLVGVAIAIDIYCLRTGACLWRMGDIAAGSAPAGLLVGRVGNFLNGELYGPGTTVFWGVVFPFAGAAPRHPTQLYEALFEGALLLVILYPFVLSWYAIARPGIVVGAFLSGYGAIRATLELYRIDIWRLEIFELSVSGAQLYSTSMIAIGLYLIWFCVAKRAGS